MAEDDDISRRYRELPREEPPRHLDDAIRAAARRAVHTRPAPLVVPTGRQRWYFPLAAAAIIVLAVAVTMHMEREQPGEEIVTSPASPAASPSSAPAETMRPEAAAEKPQPAPAPAPQPPIEAERQKAPVSPAQDAARAAQESARAEAAAEAAPSPALGAAGAVAGAELRRADEVARQSSRLAKSADRSPEQWLQGIADLRGQGRHDDADKELVEFRKRYPAYRIPEAMLEKVQRPAR